MNPYYLLVIKSLFFLKLCKHKRNYKLNDEK